MAKLLVGILNIDMGLVMHLSKGDRPDVAFDPVIQLSTSKLTFPLMIFPVPLMAII